LIPYAEFGIYVRLSVLVRRCYAHMKTEVIAFLLVFVSAFFSACSRPSNNSGEVQRLREEVERLKSAQPSAPTPPKPTISDDTKSRVLNFIEKASKLAAMTDQGVAFTPFSDQLAEVKSVWQTLTIVNWPET